MRVIKKNMNAMIIRLSTLLSALLVAYLINVVVEGAKVEVIDASLSVSKFSDTYTLKYPELITETLVLKKTATLKLNITLRKDTDGSEDEEIDQVAILLESVNKEDSVSAVFVGKLDTDVGKNAYSIQAPPKKLAKLLKGREGEYEISIIVGDKGITNSFIWRVGEINVEIDSVIAIEQLELNAPKPPITTVMKPEISHKFQEEEKRPPAPTSYAFVALVFSAIPMFLIVLLRIVSPASQLLGNFPKTFGGIMSSVFFHASCAILLYSLVLFFYKQQIFEFLPFIAGAGLLTSVTGHRLFSYLAINRLDEMAKSKIDKTE